MDSLSVRHAKSPVHHLQTEWSLPAGGGNSFTGETLVHVRDQQGKPALKPIADIKIGDEVLAWDEMAAHDGQLQQSRKGNSQEVQAKTGASAQQISATRYEKVSDVFSSEKERKLVHITLAGGKSITATDGHPFRTSEGWRDAVLLKKGAKLLLMGSGEGDDDSAGIATIEDVRVETKTVRVYNLEVENLHTFFVGDEGLVVHNGIVYRRFRFPFKPYIGKANNQKNFLQRQKCHDNKFGFEWGYDVLYDGPDAGDDLLRREQREIDSHGGPTNKGNPNGNTMNGRNNFRKK